MNMKKTAKSRKACELLEQWGEWIIVIFIEVGKK